MSQNVAAKIDSEVNFFQKHLIPPESKWVRFMMHKAGVYSCEGNFVSSRLFSVMSAICAIGMSFFNALSYFLQAPIKILLNIVNFNPIGVVRDFISDLTNVIRSMIFVSLGLTFIVIGLFLPQAIFTHFAPEYDVTPEAKLLSENEILKKKLESEEELRTKASQKTEKSLSILSNHIQELKKEIEELRSEKKKLKKPGMLNYLWQDK